MSSLLPPEKFMKFLHISQFFSHKFLIGLISFTCYQAADFKKQEISAEHLIRDM